MTNIVRSERPSAFEQELDEIADHGLDGHIGVRCYQCAQLSDIMIQLASDGGEYWQNKQLLWQEECDELQNKFDLDVATHWPNHQPIGCTTCPVVYDMPEKPLPPSERAIGHNANN